MPLKPLEIDDPSPPGGEKQLMPNPVPRIVIITAIIFAGSFLHYFSQVNKEAIERRIQEANARPRPTLSLLKSESAAAKTTPAEAPTPAAASEDRGRADGGAGTDGSLRQPPNARPSEDAPLDAADEQRPRTAAKAPSPPPVPFSFPPTGDTIARLQTEGAKLIDSGFKQAQEVGGSVLGAAAERVQKTASESAAHLQRAVWKETAGRLIRILIEQLPPDSRRELGKEVIKEYITPHQPTPRPTATP